MPVFDACGESVFDLPRGRPQFPSRLARQYVSTGFALRASSLTIFPYGVSRPFLIFFRRVATNRPSGS